MCKDCYTPLSSNASINKCSFSKTFNRALGFDDYMQSITSADFIAYLDTKKWLLAMSDFLFFADLRIRESDFFTETKKEDNGNKS